MAARKTRRVKAQRNVREGVRGREIVAMIGFSLYQLLMTCPEGVIRHINSCTMWNSGFGATHYAAIFTGGGLNGFFDPVIAAANTAVSVPEILHTKNLLVLEPGDEFRILQTNANGTRYAVINFTDEF